MGQSGKKGGPALGHHPNNSKTRLVVKEENLEDAERVFADTGNYITCTGKHHLCAAIGMRNLIEELVHEKVAVWKEALERLSAFTRSVPHAAYSAYTHGLIGK